jgi:predicted esterase
LESDGTATFHFIHGFHKAVPPEGYEDFFGGPPFFRWLEESKDPEGVDGLERIRDFPAGASPEDTLRLFNPLGSSDGLAITATQALEHLREIVKEHGPFEGIIGYSEGALMAGTLIMQEEEFKKNGDYNNKFKLAMFFGGWPPLKPDLKGMMLADETDLQLEVSTIHVSECFPALSSASIFSFFLLGGEWL